ncbi:MAG: division/cell wall cluster transcriptional repressor MraZ [Alphaproteobacteria bacterium]|nr:division/cell wall cluster transcriptional repressor MraZ [Alphaproteobacteria bacterium]
MSLFLSCYENRLDTKGRISVPAAFRSSLNSENFAGVVLFRSFKHNCIEGLSMSRMEKIASASDQMGLFDDDLDNLTAMIFADARPLQFDITGRIVIPKELLKHANITDKALFVGRGNSFQIWNPEDFIRTQQNSLTTLRKTHPNLKINNQ